MTKIKDTISAFTSQEIANGVRFVFIKNVTFPLGVLMYSYGIVLGSIAFTQVLQLIVKDTVDGIAPIHTWVIGILTFLAIASVIIGLRFAPKMKFFQKIYLKRYINEQRSFQATFKALTDNKERSDLQHKFNDTFREIKRAEMLLAQLG